MLRTLTWKEARELLPLSAVALFAQVSLPLLSRNCLLPSFRWLQEGEVIPFISDSTATWFLLIGFVAAAAIGLWQSAGELLRGTYLFLLHRPLPRPAIFATKLATGLLLTLLIAGVPLAIYTIWAATPGTHASPFFWSMSTVVWLRWLRLPVVYLGAFLSGLRPGRWLGSRILPLAAAFLCFLLLMGAEPIPWLALVLTLIVESLFLIAILYVGESRDFS